MNCVTGSRAAQYDFMTSYYDLPSLFDAKYPNLKNFLKTFAELPQNSKYLNSKLNSMPFNNKMASFNAHPNGDAWKPEYSSSYDWGDLSGEY